MLWEDFWKSFSPLYPYPPKKPSHTQTQSGTSLGDHEDWPANQPCFTDSRTNREVAPSSKLDRGLFADLTPASLIGEFQSIKEV